MKYLGIDYGTKRIGLATSDENGEFAFPKEIIENNSSAVSYIETIITSEKYAGVVVGDSKASNEEANEVSREINQFVDKLKEKNIIVYTEQEGYSSVEAYRYQQMRGPADDRAAAIILQRFLDKKIKNNN